MSVFTDAFEQRLVKILNDKMKEAEWGVHNYNDNLNYYVRGQYHKVNKYASSAFYKKNYFWKNLSLFI